MLSDIQSVLSSAASMATTYNSVSKQAEKGEVANSSIDDLIQNGLNSANMKIKNNIHEDITIDNCGITGRSWDDITGNYSPKQVKFTHNLLLFTRDNWRSSELGIGEMSYKLDGKTYEDYGIITKYLIAGKTIAGDIYSSNYSSTTGKGSHINLNNGSFTLADSKIVYDSDKNKLTLKGMEIEWSSSTTPEISDIDGLNDELGSKVTQTDFDNTMKNYSTTEQVDAKITVSKTEISSEMNKQITETKTYADNAASTAQTNAINSANTSTDNKLKSYSTTTQMNSAINQKADEINLSVSKQVTETKTYAKEVADAAESNANTATNNKLKSYSTTTEMNSAINQKADSINLSVTEQITETKTYADTVASTAQTNAINNTTEKLKSYSTTTQMNAAIDLKADAITSTVAATYETKGDATSKYNTLSSSITQTANSITSQVNAVEKNLTDNYSTTTQMNSAITQSANSIESKVVSKTDYNGKELVSLINQTAEAVSINANKINLNGAVTANNYFKINTDGSMEATNGTFSGAITATSGKIANFVINDHFIQTEDEKVGFGDNDYWAFWAGFNKDTGDIAFRVDQDGNVICSSLNATGGNIGGCTFENGKLKVPTANIDGTITATKVEAATGTLNTVTATNLTVTSGTITLGDATLNSNGLTVTGTNKTSKLGCVKIDENSLYIGSWGGSSRKTPDVFMCSGSSTSQSLGGSDTIDGWCFGAGSNFGVTKTGELYCSAGKIGGMNIDNDGTLRGDNIRIYPSEPYVNSGRNYYLVIFDSFDKPIGGIASDGWHPISA